MTSQARTLISAYMRDDARLTTSIATGPLVKGEAPAMHRSHTRDCDARGRHWAEDHTDAHQKRRGALPTLPGDVTLPWEANAASVELRNAAIAAAQAAVDTQLYPAAPSPTTPPSTPGKRLKLF